MQTLFGVSSMANTDIPSKLWNKMSENDKVYFLRLKHHFHEIMKSKFKEHNVSSFYEELVQIHNFLEHNCIGWEERCFVSGIALVGPIIAVNSRLLMGFLSRCKSSINGCFQTMGYHSLKSKTQTREFINCIFPSCAHESSYTRQWTIRFASDNTTVCFLSSHIPKNLPSIHNCEISTHSSKKTEPAFRDITPKMRIENGEFIAKLFEEEPHIPQIPNQYPAYSENEFSNDTWNQGDQSEMFPHSPNDTTSNWGNEFKQPQNFFID